MSAQNLTSNAYTLTKLYDKTLNETDYSIICSSVSANRRAAIPVEIEPKYSGLTFNWYLTAQNGSVGSFAFLMGYKINNEFVLAAELDAIPSVSGANMPYFGFFNIINNTGSSTFIRSIGNANFPSTESANYKTDLSNAGYSVNNRGSGTSETTMRANLSNDLLIFPTCENISGNGTWTIHITISGYNA